MSIHVNQFTPPKLLKLFFTSFLFLASNMAIASCVEKNIGKPNSGNVFLTIIHSDDKEAFLKRGFKTRICKTQEVLYKNTLMCDSWQSASNETLSDIQQVLGIPPALVCQSLSRYLENA